MGKRPERGITTGSGGEGLKPIAKNPEMGQAWRFAVALSQAVTSLTADPRWRAKIVRKT